MSVRPTLLALLVVVSAGALTTALPQDSSPGAPAHRGAGDPSPRSYGPSPTRRSHHGTHPSGRRRLPSVAELATRLDEADSQTCEAASDGWFASDDHLVQYEPTFRPHVESVGAYLNDVFAPRLRDCVAGFEPVGWVEVVHSFEVDDWGVARPASLAGTSDAAVVATDSDFDDVTLAHILDCMNSAATDTSFAHVALFEHSPELGFIAYQGYQFGPAD